MYSELFNKKEEDIVFYIKEKLEVRYIHIMETRELSIKLAKHYNIDAKKASLTALLHDISKYYSNDDMRKIIYDYDKTIYPSHYTNALMHAKASAAIAKSYFSITSKDVLNAIERHTVGGRDMSMLDKIIYTSDYLEPSRKLDIADKLREKIFEDFDYVFEVVVILSIQYVIDTKRFLDHNSIDLYNSIVLK